MENEYEALPGVAYPGVLDNCSTLNTKTGYDDDDMLKSFYARRLYIARTMPWQDVCPSVCLCVRHTPVVSLNGYR